MTMFRVAADVHSIAFHGGALFAVSTGTDEIVAVTLDGPRMVAEDVIWRPEPDAPRTDSHHLNALAVSDDEILVCGFGKRSEALWSSARQGFIRTTRGKTLASDLLQPHSLFLDESGVLYCESRVGAVRVVGEPSRVSSLPGYTRGLCRAGEFLYVGCSIGRRQSKSTGLMIENSSDPGETAGLCGLGILCADSWNSESFVDLAEYGDEIYDLLPLNPQQVFRKQGA